MFLRKGVLKICSKFTGEHPCRSAISINLLCTFIEITLRYGCSPVNLLHIFRAHFLKNTSGWLLLKSLTKAGSPTKINQRVVKYKQNLLKSFSSSSFPDQTWLWIIQNTVFYVCLGVSIVCAKMLGNISDCVKKYFFILQLCQF